MGEGWATSLSIGEITGIISAVAAVFGAGWVLYTYYERRHSLPGLTISSLSGPGRLKPVPGTQPFFDEVLKANVYPEGVKAAFLLQHNQAGSAAVSLTAVSLNVERVAGREGQLPDWSIDATKRPPAAAAKMKRAENFKLTLDETAVESAYWKGIKLDSKNFLESADGMQDFHIDLLANDETAELAFDVSLVSEGLYRLRFDFTYVAAGKTAIEQSDEILVCMED